MNRTLASLASLASLLATGALAGCDLAPPFDGPGYTNGAVTTKADGPFIAATTWLVLKDTDVSHTAFDAHMKEINAALKDAPGLVGSSVGLKIGAPEYRTLTVWETEEDMLAFVTGDAHAAAMQDMADKADQGETASWSIAREEMPPTWDDAKAHLASDPVIAY